MLTKASFKKVVVSGGIAAALLVVPLVTSQAIGKSATFSPTVAQTQQERMNNLKTRADNEVSRRVTSLSSLISRINLMKHLSASQKSTFIASINSQINSLNTLKTKLDNDTDLTTLKTDVQSIVDSYRVFVVYMPQIELLAAADRIDDIAMKLNDLATKLQIRLTSASARGNNITSLETTLKDMTSKVADAVTQYNNVDSSIIPLTPTGYPGNKTTLIAARKMIQTGHQDLVAALQDAKTIIQGLKALQPKTATSSATP